MERSTKRGRFGDPPTVVSYTSGPLGDKNADDSELVPDSEPILVDGDNQHGNIVMTALMEKILDVDDDSISFPFCGDEGFPWISGDWSGIWQKPLVCIIVVVFGEWVRSGVCVVGGEPVNVYVKSFDEFIGLRYQEAISEKVVYSCEKNVAVYHDSDTTLHGLVEMFVEYMTKYGWFDKQLGGIIPDFLCASMKDLVLIKIVGTAHTSRDPSGGLAAKYGISSVRDPIRTRWAFGNYVLRIPPPISTQDWDSKLKPPTQLEIEMDSEFEVRKQKYGEAMMKTLPQLTLMKDTEFNENQKFISPSIPSTRWFKCDGGDMACLKEQIDTLNLSVMEYIKQIKDLKDDVYELRQWVSSYCLELLHVEKWCPNFMSTIGAQ
jgi:hypothetical protein